MLDTAQPTFAQGGIEVAEVFAYTCIHCANLQPNLVSWKKTLPADTKVDADVGIGQIPNGFGIKVDMAISIPGMDRAEAEKLVEAAHVVCPYSNATRGNIEVKLVVPAAA